MPRLLSIRIQRSFHGSRTVCMVFFVFAVSNCLNAVVIARRSAAHVFLYVAGEGFISTMLQKVYIF